MHVEETSLANHRKTLYVTLPGGSLNLKCQRGFHRLGAGFQDQQLRRLLLRCPGSLGSQSWLGRRIRKSRIPSSGDRTWLGQGMYP